MTNKYFIVGDVHIFDKELSGRKSYKDEVKGYMSIIKSRMVKEKSINPETKLYLIFSGDIFHKNLKDAEEILYWINWFIELRLTVDGIFTLMGNHEWTNRNNNLLWSLCNSIESEYLQDKKILPKGAVDIVRMPDYILDGQVLIHLEHFGDKKVPLEGYINMCITHNTKTFRGIEVSKDNPIYYTDVEYRDNPMYDYTFIGHVHSLYGLFIADNDAQVFYLSSLGRTNHTEVDNEMLDRCVPCITVKDGVLEEVNYDFTFKLQTRDESLDISEISKKQQVYSNRKDRKEIKEIITYNKGVESVKDVFRLLKDTDTVALISLLEKEPGQVRNWIEYMVGGKYCEYK